MGPEWSHIQSSPITSAFSPSYLHNQSLTSCPLACLLRAEYSDIVAWGAGNQFDIVLRVGKIPSGKITDPLQDVRDLSTCTNQVSFF
eukprot:1158565-Pelagomonas_calceolata.AAC.7